MSTYKDKSLYDRITDRQAMLVKKRQPFDAARKEICSVFRPDLTLTVDDKGDFVGSDIIEGTAPWALGVNVRGFLSSMVGKSLEWIRYIMQERRFHGIDEVNKAMQELEHYMYDVYERSNYYSVLPLFVKDGLSIGSPVMFADEDIAGARANFTLPHYSENYISQNWLGQDDVYHRGGGWKMTAKQAAEEFDLDELSDSLKLDIEHGSHDNEYKFLMAMYSENDRIFDDLKESDKKFKPTGPWMQYYIQVDTDVGKKKPLLAKPYWYKPFTVWHYHRNPHESYSRTPAWFSIFDTKGNNAGWLTQFELVESVARPPMWSMAEYKGREHFAPGGVTRALNADDYGRPPVSLNKGGNYQVATDFLDRLKGNVERHFHVKLFQMIEQYNREHKQPPTAYQIFQMIGENAAQVGPEVESFERDILAPNDSILMDMEFRSGRMVENVEFPEVLFNSNGIVVPKFVGPLSQAQKVHHGVQRVHQGLAATQPIREEWPETKYKIRAAKLTEKVLENMNFPQDCIVPEDEYNEDMAELAALEAEDRKLEQAERIAKAIPSISKDVEEGSPLAALTEGVA